MRSLENSRGPWVRANMGAVKRGQRASQLWRHEGKVRDADVVRASQTAPTKRVQRKFVSSCVVVGVGGGGDAEMIFMNSCLV